MRLSKVDPTQAAQVANSAFQAGVIMDNADNAVMRHDNNYLNPVGNTLNSTEAANFYMTAPFVDHLKSNDDPRLSAIAIRYVGAKSGPEQVPAIGSTDPDVQIGMPLGHDNATIVPVAASLGLASFYDFTQIDRLRLAGRFAPAFFCNCCTNAVAVGRSETTRVAYYRYFRAGILSQRDTRSYESARGVWIRVSDRAG